MAEIDIAEINTLEKNLKRFDTFIFEKDFHDLIIKFFIIHSNLKFKKKFTHNI